MIKYIVIALSFLFLTGCGQSNSGLDINCYSGNTLIYQASDVSLNRRILGLFTDADRLHDENESLKRRVAWLEKQLILK